ncbi:hypothetical protein HIM_08713 [Hirsutella minnesotensis 3608]|uniref:Uncharacterized protein n=1 Tax=Hirsutella minnesotensis 3608 TaxID=1043627 RepID=A0A0F7ZSS4_9HYPO|nr:hypothetical protein HIM_08713 [Hirsutella minnesotensis 3608]
MSFTASKYTAVVAAVAALQGVSAQGFSENDIRGRLENQAEYGTPCYLPVKSYTLSKPGQEQVPPCIAEQGISALCEKFTEALTGAETEGEKQESLRAYKACLTGEKSTYKQDVLGCLKCKVQENFFSEAQGKIFGDVYDKAFAAFEEDETPKGGFWASYFQRFMNWDQYSSLPVPDGPKGTKALNHSAYYNFPEVQGLGEFTLRGKKYPEAALREEGLLPKEPIQRLDGAPGIVNVVVDDKQKPLDAPKPTTLLPVPSASKLPGNFQNTTASTAAPAPTKAAGDDQVGIVRALRDVDCFLQFFANGFLEFMLTPILSKPQPLADQKPVMVRRTEVIKLEVVVVTDIQELAPPVKVDSKERIAAAENTEGGKVAEKVVAIKGRDQTELNKAVKAIDEKTPIGVVGDVARPSQPAAPKAETASPVQNGSPATKTQSPAKGDGKFPPLTVPDDFDDDVEETPKTANKGTGKDANKAEEKVADKDEEEVADFC